MKTKTRLLSIAGSCGVILLSALAAQADEPGWYLKADAGGTITSDTELKEFFNQAVAPGAKVKFDPGVRIGFAGGYQFTDWFALEAETGVIANKIKSIDGATRVDDASMSNVPLLFNVRFQGPKDQIVSPYVGAGAGTSISVLDADHIDYGAVSLHGNQSDAVFAYQAFGGLRFRLNEHMGLSVEYRYFATKSPEWEDNDFGPSLGKVAFGEGETHSVSVSFEYKF